MLSELKEVNQEKDGFRRIYIGTEFDLFVWYDKKGGSILGFELCYDKDEDERSITWRKTGGYLHSRIDTGENNPGRRKQSPVLVADGVFDSGSVADKFRQNSSKVDKQIADLVYNKLLEYPV